jgi:hypothetical protein
MALFDPASGTNRNVLPEGNCCPTCGGKLVNSKIDFGQRLVEIDCVWCGKSKTSYGPSIEHLISQRKSIH